MTYRIALLTVPLLLAGMAAHAQSGTAPTIPPAAGGSTSSTPAPLADPGGSAKPSGVIHPGNPDAGMTVTPPQMGSMPVIPPPGTAGNAAPVVPK